MKKIEIKKLFQEKQQSRYVYLPFDIESNIDHIEITYSYPRFNMINNRKEELNIIDIGLAENQSTLCGWSGSNKSYIYISEYYATPGYQKIKLEAGTWFIALGLYKITKTVNITVTINQYQKNPSWLSGDLHIHTLNSDGQYTVHEVMKYCKKQQLDFIALTDHNNTEQNKDGNSEKKLSVIHGIEYTNYKGHANFFFQGTKLGFPMNPLTNSFNQMRQLFVTAKQEGCLISLNHPFDTSCPWLFGFENFPFDVVEIWNGIMSQDNMKAIRWWHSYLTKGNRLPIIGGSDTHGITPLRTFGCPTTMVYTSSRDPNSILAAIKAGHSIITYYIDGPRIDFRINDAITGDSILFMEKQYGSISLTELKIGDEIILLSDEKKEAQWIAKQTGMLQVQFAVNKRQFYRVELYRTIGTITVLIALSNPIYLT
jgi:hypothetical protein